MSENENGSKVDWNSPEAIAFFQREVDHAIKQSKAVLAKACEPGGVFEAMSKLPGELLDEIADKLGKEHYLSLIHLIYEVPYLVRESRDVRKALDLDLDPML
jgi:hypothetical protein